MFGLENLSSIILSTLAVLIILPIHELAHGFAAYKLGDPTAKNLGRLTLNPIKHLDIFGTLSLILFHFGWAKPVPVNVRNLRKPRRDFAIVALAGPLTNLTLSFFTVPLWLALRNFYISTYTPDAFLTTFLLTALDFVGVFHSINLGLAIFNLIPVPPLDGSRILTALLPPKATLWLARNERNIYIGLLIWLFAGDIVARALLSVPIVASSSVLSFIAGLFSLSDLLAGLNMLISDLMFSLWELIPAFRI